MELKTNFPNRKGFLTNAEFIDSAKVESKLSNSKARRGNFKVELKAKTERQVNKISRKVEQQMTRQQLRRMKKMGLA